MASGRGLGATSVGGREGVAVGEEAVSGSGMAIRDKDKGRSGDERNACTSPTARAALDR
jgi:hypothetical protein